MDTSPRLLHPLSRYLQVELSHCPPSFCAHRDFEYLNQYTVLYMFPIILATLGRYWLFLKPPGMIALAENKCPPPNIISDSETQNPYLYFFWAGGIQRIEDNPESQKQWFGSSEPFCLRLVCNLTLDHATRASRNGRATC